MGANDITEPQRQPFRQSWTLSGKTTSQGKGVAIPLLRIPFPSVAAAGSFPLIVQEQPRQGRSYQWERTTSQSHKGNHRRNGHTKDARTTIRGTQENRQGKNVAIPLLRLRSLCCGCWLVPSVSSRSTKARPFVSMGANDITELQRQPFRQPLCRLATCNKICGYSTILQVVVQWSFLLRCGLCWLLVPFTLRVQEATKATIRGKQDNRHGKNVAVPLLRIPFPL